MNQLRISLVIPAYNEERHLRACLESIAHQTIRPTEVIVVDNNSSDATSAIATEYSFVTLIAEPQQGRAHARNAGFNVATGHVIARVDADVVLPPDWIQVVGQAFSKTPNLGGVSGLAFAALFFTGPWMGTFWSRVYYWVNDSYFRLPTLWGANMAIRQEAWRQVSPGLCSDDAAVHEDIDLSLALWANGWQIRHDSKLIVSTNGREYLRWPKLMAYTALRRKTKEHNIANGMLARAAPHYLPLWRVATSTILTIVPAAIFIMASRILQTVRYKIQSGR